MAENIAALIADMVAAEPPAVTESDEHDANTVAWKISYSTYRA